MSTNAIIGIIVALIIVVGGAWYVMHAGNSAPANATNTSNQTTNTAASGTSGSGTFASMMGMSGSYKCTVSSNGSSALSNGVVYISNGNMRVDFTGSASGSAVDGHMIKSGDEVYTWTSAYPQGMKMKASAMMGGSSSQGSGQQSFNANTSVDYSCEPSSVDAGMFVAPTNITFMDVSAMMPR